MALAVISGIGKEQETQECSIMNEGVQSIQT